MSDPIMLTIVHADDRVMNVLSAMHQAVTDELVPRVIEAQMLVEREVRDRSPTSGAGVLRESIGALPVTIGETSVTGIVGTAISYAAPVEDGSKPHRPPVEPIAEWVRRKLGKRPDEAATIAWAIAGKIARDGTEGRHMFRDGLAAVQSQILALLGEGASAALRRIES